MYIHSDCSHTNFVRKPTFIDDTASSPFKQLSCTALRPLDNLTHPLTKEEEEYHTHLTKIKVSMSADKATLRRKTRGQPVVYKRIVVLFWQYPHFARKDQNSLQRLDKMCPGAQQMILWSSKAVNWKENLKPPKKNCFRLPAWRDQLFPANKVQHYAPDLVWVGINTENIEDSSSPSGLRYQAHTWRG